MPNERRGFGPSFFNLREAMAKLLLDYNPITGERVFFGFNNHENKVTITHEQDVDEHLKLAHAQAIDDTFTKKGIKNDWWKYASVPNVIIIDMKNKFLNY